MRIVKLFVR